MPQNWKKSVYSISIFYWPRWEKKEKWFFPKKREYLPETELWVTGLDKKHIGSKRVVAVQLLSYVWLFVTPWTAAHQASLSCTISWSLLKFMSIALMMPSNYLIFCHLLLLLPLFLPSIRVFSTISKFESVLEKRALGSQFLCYNLEGL